MASWVHIIFKQVTCETTEVLCADPTVEREVGAVRTGLYWVQMPEGTSFEVSLRL